MKRKQLHQVKTQWYYVFWAIATVAVVSGQIYVGSGVIQWRTSSAYVADLVKLADLKLEDGGNHIVIVAILWCQTNLKRFIRYNELYPLEELAPPCPT